MLEFLLFIVYLAGSWRIFQKMGHAGWEGIIPVYNIYVVFKELYGCGWKFLFLLIPFVNIFFIFKSCIDLAKSFGYGAAFGIGLVFLPWFFIPFLGFGSHFYMDGSRACKSSDPVSSALDQVADAVNGKSNGNTDARANGYSREKNDSSYADYSDAGYTYEPVESDEAEEPEESYESEDYAEHIRVPDMSEHVNTGNGSSAEDAEIRRRLQQEKDLLKEGFITKEEFEERTKKIIDNM